MRDWIFFRHWTARLFAPVVVGIFCGIVEYLSGAHPHTLRDAGIGMLLSMGIFSVFKEVTDRIFESRTTNHKSRK